jgi:YD repeat-containing protein
MSPEPVLYTVGHSSQSVESFVGALQAHRIEVIADVRSMPYSSRYPHFSREALQKSLIVAGIRYLFLGRELGARRDEPECYVDGRASYEEIAKLPNFQRGVERLLEAAQMRRIALMCAEQDPLTCHRTILICRALSRHGIAIRHIERGGAVEEHPQAEQRRLREEFGDDSQGQLFGDVSPSDTRLQQAYTARGNRIAYRRGSG